MIAVDWLQIPEAEMTMVALSPAKEPIVIMGEDLNQQRRSEC